MKLNSAQISKLTKLEKSLYKPLIGDVSSATSLRNMYIAQSLRYVENDEKVLPFPERCKKGIMLFSLSQHLSAPSPRESVILGVKNDELGDFIKQKVAKLGNCRAYLVNSELLNACVYADGQNPFQYFRDRELGKQVLQLNKLDYREIICAIKPSLEVVRNTSEYELLGIYSKNVDGVSDIAKQAAHAGLTEVQDISKKSLYIHR